MSELMQIGIIGGGYVGKATALLACENVKTFIYDIDKEKCDPLGLRLEEIACCCLIFVCVPTPMREDRSCDTSIVEGVVKSLVDLGVDRSKIIVRSTVSIGTCKRLRVGFMPEFLTEANWGEDFINNKDWIFGVNVSLIEPYTDEPFSSFKKLINLAYESGKIKSKVIHCTSTESAELTKLTRNSFFALKVSFFNEIYDLCKRKEIDFETVRRCVSLDERIGESHTKVPGSDGEKGYGGTCLPKDSKSLLFQMHETYMKSYILSATIDRNDELDRLEYFKQIDLTII